VGDSQSYTAAKARATIECRVCGKPRVIYAHRATAKQAELAELVEECQFTCNSVLIDVTSELPAQRAFVDGHGAALLKVRPLSCAAPVEWALYSSKSIELASPPCSWCGKGVDESNGLGFAEKCNENPGQQIMPRCDSPDCIAAGFVERKKRKASKISL
jgi:hypothetical protein